jgi:hypothetical protein
MTRSLAASCFLLASASALAAAPVDPASASGQFEDKKLKLEIVSAYAFWGKSSGMGDDEVVRVAVSNDKFNAAFFDDHYDRGHAISTLFADDESKVVYFEFNADGKYRGLSYYFGQGVGCGFCYDSKVGSTVRAAGGRLKGDLSYKGDDRQFQIALDVPIPSKVWGDPLPKDGGDPGRAYLAYHAALGKGDRKALFPLLDADTKARWKKYEAEGKLDEYVDYRWDEMHVKMKSVSLSGGFVRGDRAVVLFTGSSSLIDHLYGEALLRKEGGVWLVHADMIDVGSR